MTGDIQFVLAIIFLASVLFASGRVRFDIVSCMVIISLCLGGILTPDEAFSGFGNPLVVLVTGMFIVNSILTRTGVASALGEWLARAAGDSEWRLTVLMMGGGALLGSVMGSIAVVASLIPVVLRQGRESGIQVSRVLLPMACAVMIGGMLTLIGALPSLIVNAELTASGYEGFGFFGITPLGLVILAAALVYMPLLSRYLLPDRQQSEAAVVAQTNQELMNEFGLVSRGALFSLPGDSLLVGLKIKDSLFTRFSARILLVQRYEVFGESIIANPSGAVVLKPGDNILLAASEEVCEELARAAGLERRRITRTYIERWEREAGNAVVMVHPESNLVGRSLSSIHFSDVYNVHVLAIKRRAEIHQPRRSFKLEAGDQLLLAGGWEPIAELSTWSSTFVVISSPQEVERYVPQRRKAPVALLIVLLMMLLSALQVVPLVIAVLLAVAAGILTRCIDMDDIYKAIPWSAIVLIAGLLPVVGALQKTGGVELMVEGLVVAVGQHGVLAMMSVLFFLSAFLGLVTSGTASVVLLAPIAIHVAEVLDVAPQAFGVSVVVAASAAIVSPFSSSPVVTLVVEPGAYRLADFFRLGLPLLIVSWLVTVFLAPVLFPLR